MEKIHHEQSKSALPDTAEFDPKDGLFISGSGNNVYSFKTGPQDVLIEQVIKQSADNLKELHLHFKMAAPTRFNVNIWIPASCQNACISVNRQLLLNWFAREPRLDLSAVILSPCSADDKTISTLKPGKYQAISFRWQNGDHLVTYMID